MEQLVLTVQTQGQGATVSLPSGGTVTVGPGSAAAAVAAAEAEVFKETWTTAYINALPDSAFLYIEPGGKKDEEGKTTPRSKRHFPVRGKDGKLDPPHVRNALARIPQSNVPDSVKTRCTAQAKRLLASINKGVGAVRFFTPTRVIKLEEPAGTTMHVVMNVVLEPCTKDATKDTQGDYYTDEDIEGAFNTFCEKQGVGVLHVNPDTRGIYLRDNFLVRKDTFGGDIKLGGQVVKAGSWIMAMGIDEQQNPDAWKAVQDGDYNAFSIEGDGERDEIQLAEAA